MWVWIILIQAATELYLSQKLMTVMAHTGEPIMWAGIGLSSRRLFHLVPPRSVEEDVPLHTGGRVSINNQPAANPSSERLVVLKAELKPGVLGCALSFAWFKYIYTTVYIYLF